MDRLAAAMLIAFIVVSPMGAAQALPAFTSITLPGAGLAVGVCSSVIPYACDQLAMASCRAPRLRCCWLCCRRRRLPWALWCLGRFRRLLRRLVWDWLLWAWSYIGPDEGDVTTGDIFQGWGQVLCRDIV